MKDQIRKSIREIAKVEGEMYSIVCTVESVDTSAKTCKCVPVDGKSDLLGVRLMAQNQTGFYIIPKVDSVVVVTMTNGFTGYVAMFSEVQEIQLNGDNYDGLVQIQKVVQKLNNLENKVNTHITTYNAHTHAGVTSGVSSTAIPSAIVAGTLTPTTQADLENTTVKHGNG